ncbi:hypothetical protein, partial [Candidatus Thiosymbion oneisti]|uniref:hypothetical protein n=1 Tax=Candidatus Thiosymbion oneisti TaxID=589554 RepID=UPI001C4077AE
NGSPMSITPSWPTDTEGDFCGDTSGLNLYCHLKISDTTPSTEMTSQPRPVTALALRRSRSSHVAKKSTFAVDASASGVGNVCFSHGQRRD